MANGVFRALGAVRGYRLSWYSLSQQSQLQPTVAEKLASYVCTMAAVALRLRQKSRLLSAHFLSCLRGSLHQVVSFVWTLPNPHDGIMTPCNNR